MQPPLARKGYAVSTMDANENAKPEPQASDEELLDAALQELRAAKTDGTEVEIPAAPATQEAASAAAPETAPAPSPSPAPAGAPAAAPAQPADELAATQKELQRARSELGRLNALDRKTADQAREIQQLRDEAARLKAPAEPSATTAEALSKLDALKEQVKDLPELLALVDVVGTALKQTGQNVADIARKEAAQAVEQHVKPLEPLRRDFTERQQSEATERFNTSMATFNETYPTAEKVVATPDFTAWLQKQPGNVQHAFFKGQTPDEAMSVMDTYDAHLRRTGQPSIAATPNPAPAPNASAPAALARAAAPAPSKRLMAAAGMPSRGGGQQGALPPSDDFDTSLAHFRAKRLAAAAAAGARA